MCVMITDVGVKRACEAMGSAAELARALNVTRSAISQWPKIPAERVVEIEQLTGVPRHLLRPDLHLPPAYHRAAE